MLATRRAVLMTLLSLLLCTTGCATIVNGKTQDVRLASRPSGAVVNVDSTQVTTPGIVSLKRDRDHTLVFTKEGFPERRATLDKELSVWVFGNVLLGIFPGIVVDLMNGSGYRLTPDSVDMDMATGSTRPIEEVAKRPTPN